MKLFFDRSIWIAAFAIFSMFFGAGNTVFPLSLGTLTGPNIVFASLGLAVTAIGAPLLGLISATLFEGDCKTFFFRLGPVTGSALLALCFALLGPFGAIPRCFTVANAALSPILPTVSPLFFSVIFALAAIWCCIRGSRWFTIIGSVLSPALIGCLLLIIIGSLPWDVHSFLNQSLTENFSFFSIGLLKGYETMDLIAALLFATTIWFMVSKETKNPKAVFQRTFLCSIIAATFLLLIYLGLCFAAAGQREHLLNIPGEHLMTELALYTLGTYLGITANIAIALACLTTVIGLAETIAVLLKQFFPKMIGSITTWSIIIIICSACIAPIGFAAITNTLCPILTICYPAMIVLALCNTAYKLWGYTPVKIPFWIAIGVSLLSQSGLSIDHGLNLCKVFQCCTLNISP